MSPSEIKFTYNDQKITAVAGQSVGAALLAANIRSLRLSRFDQNKRGIFCGIGVCFDCLVVINGVANQRACVIEAKNGMNVQTQVGSNA